MDLDVARGTTMAVFDVTTSDVVPPKWERVGFAFSFFFTTIRMYCPVDKKSSDCLRSHLDIMKNGIQADLLSSMSSLNQYTHVPSIFYRKLV